MKALCEIMGLPDLDALPVFNRQNFHAATLGDSDLQRQLIESFLRQRAATRENLTAAAHAGQGQFSEAVHQLKGICHFTAAERMLRIVRSIEGADRLKDGGDRMLAAQALLEGLDQLEQALVGVLSEQDSR